MPNVIDVFQVFSSEMSSLTIFNGVCAETFSLASSSMGKFPELSLTHFSCNYPVFSATSFAVYPTGFPGCIICTYCSLLPPSFHNLQYSLLLITLIKTTLFHHQVTNLLQCLFCSLWNSWVVSRKTSGIPAGSLLRWLAWDLFYNLIILIE